MRLIVGLGNPGSRYADTRHNVGFMLVDRLAKRYRAAISKRQCSGLLGFAEVAGDKLCLAKPQGYMNLSGESVGCLMRYYKVPCPTCSWSTTTGTYPWAGCDCERRAARADTGASSRSFPAWAPSEFPRLRIGIGRPSETDAVDHVLGDSPPKSARLLRRHIGQGGGGSRDRPPGQA